MRNTWLIALCACGHQEAAPDAAGDASGFAPTTQTYIKASNTGVDDVFALTALSADGSTLVVGAPGEGSRANHINGDQSDNSARYAGAAYVFVRSGDTWSEQAYLKASNAEAGDGFGLGVTISGDGETIAIGAPAEASNATGVGGDQLDNSVGGNGAAYVFTRTGDKWTQQAYLKSATGAAGVAFGNAIALSHDGNRLIVGAVTDASSTTGIDSSPDAAAPVSGAAYVFSRAGATWTQQAYVKASNTDPNDKFGYSVAISGDGDAIAVGAVVEASARVDDEANNSAYGAGAAYVFRRANGVWTQDAYLKASDAVGNDNFGYSIAMSADGNTIAVGSIAKSQPAQLCGGVYVFKRETARWMQEGNLLTSRPDFGQFFGATVALSRNGSTLLASAPREASRATGIDGDPTDASMTGAGAAYVFTRSQGGWNQATYVKATNTETGDGFGFAAMSADARTIAIGANQESSAATGIDGDQSNNDAANSGAVYVYR